jgi:hypothetical protein
MTWNPAEHSDDDNLQWCWLRAVEWGRWPIFLSQPLAPALLIWFPWQAVVVGVIIANLLWAFFIRYRFVSAGAADAGVLFVLLKWLSWPVATFYLFHVGRKPECWVALAWPVLIFVIGAFPTTQVGRIQVWFMQALVSATLGRGADAASAALVSAIGGVALLGTAFVVR